MTLGIKYHCYDPYVDMEVIIHRFLHRQVKPCRRSAVHMHISFHSMAHLWQLMSHAAAGILSAFPFTHAHMHTALSRVCLLPAYLASRMQSWHLTCTSSLWALTAWLQSLTDLDSCWLSRHHLSSSVSFLWKSLFADQGMLDPFSRPVNP